MLTLPSLVPLTLEQAITDPGLCQRLLDPHRQICVSCFWGHCSFLLGPSTHKGFFVPPPIVCFPSPVKGQTKRYSEGSRQLWNQLSETKEEGSQAAVAVRNPPANTGVARDMCSILGLRRSPGGGNDNPIHHPCLENPTDRGALGLQSLGSRRAECD